MTNRYYLQTPVSGRRALLAGAEAHHLIRVMRAEPGDKVVLFDGSGTEYTACVRRVDRTEVELDVLSSAEVDRELPLELVLAVALPKGDRQKWLVEKAVELGVSRIVPLRTARAVAQPVQQALARLRRTAIEASKQCGRNRLLEIAEPQNWCDFVAETADLPYRLLAHRCGKQGRCGRLSTADLPRQVLLAVGPEGGFTAEEVSAALSTGWRPVDLGPRTLRVETAALLLVAIVAEAQ